VWSAKWTPGQVSSSLATSPIQIGAATHLLLIPLDGVGVAEAGLLRVVSGLAECASLAQQIPALIELGRDPPEALAAAAKASSLDSSRCSRSRSVCSSSTKDSMRSVRGVSSIWK
jgi:hypothetical protein